MSGKTLLQNLLASCGLAAAATATAASVASGQPGMSAEDQTAGTESLEKLVEAAHEEGRQVGIKEGRTAERERFGAVLTDTGTAGKLGLAISLLSTTDLPADTIISNLKAASRALEGVTSAEETAGTGTGQRAAKDPKAADAIAEDTSLVDTGAARPPVDGMDEKEVVNLWAGALGGVNGGITTGGVWDGLTTQPAPRTN